MFVLSNWILSSTPESSSLLTFTAIEIYHVVHCSYWSTYSLILFSLRDLPAECIHPMPFYFAAPEQSFGTRDCLAKNFAVGLAFPLEQNHQHDIEKKSHA